MKLLQIKPFYFRAFCVSAPVVFNTSLTIFYGGNGAGKSSLSEALEWLLYGYTKRRRKGDEYSKNEYKGSYVHNACPTGTAPYVEAQVKLADGSIHLIRRTMKLNKAGLALDQESTLSVDNTPVADLSPINLAYTEAQCPVIVQHGIQDFIHMRPIDRYRVISEALGLSELVEFKDTLERAKIQRRNYPSTEVAQAKKIVAQLIANLKSVDLVTLATRWQLENYSVDADYSLILDKARELSGSQATTLESALKDVRTRQTEEISRVFDIAPFQPNPHLGTTLEQIPPLVAQIQEADAKFKMADATYTGATASSYKVAQLEFWKQGLTLVDTANPEQCPFCEESTITPNKIRGLEARLEADDDLSKSRRSFLRETDSYIALLSQAEQKLPQLEFDFISDKNVSALEKLFESDRERLQAFAAENRQSVQLVRSLRETITWAKDSLSNLKTFVTQPNKVIEAAVTVADIPTRIGKALAEATTSLKQYNEIFVTFKPIFERELSDEATVTKFTSLVDILNNHASVRLIADAKAFDSEILEAQRLVEEHILDQQKVALTSRETEILSWYGLLSPNTDVKFSGLEPGRSEYSLKAEAFGKTMNAAASLSQSQLNCLGLSIYIPSVSAPDSPFKFILFDDPVQAMDDDHHESFLLKVIPELMNKHDFEVIVLTHLKETADRLRDINFTGNFTYYRFDKLQATGPVIVEHIILSDDMKKIRQLAQGNDDNREMAVDRIRVLCENIMREAHLRKKGFRMSVASGTASSMVPHFAQVPSVTPAMVTEIQDTINWSNPAHHTPPGYVVPATTNINPHIERLQKMINDLGLKK